MGSPWFQRKKSESEYGRSLRAFKVERWRLHADTRLVLIDEPTGLFNRHGWELLLGREESRCVRYGSAAAVLMAELDACAEELLPRAAEVLSAAVRPSDVVARLEGETFAVLLLECDRATAVRVRDRVERELTAAGVPVAVGVASRGRGVPLQAAAQAACAALAVRRRERQASAEA